MPQSRRKPRKGSHKKDVQLREELISTAVQQVLRATLDVIMWWISRGGHI